MNAHSLSSSPPPRTTAARVAGRDWIDAAIQWASGVAAVAMFVYGVALSYAVLHAIAAAARLPSWAAGLWPLGFEAFMASAALNALAEQRHRRGMGDWWRRVPWYPWTLTGLTAGASILLNWFHPAIPLDPPPGWLVSVVYGLPPLIAVFAWHLFLQRVAHRRQLAPVAAAGPAAYQDVPPAVPVPEVPPASTVAVPVPARDGPAPVPVPGGRPAGDPPGATAGTEPATAPPLRAGTVVAAGRDGEDPDGVMRRYFAAERAKGRTPSGAELDRLVSRDPRNGAGRKARARYLTEAQQASADAPASTVPGSTPAGNGTAVRLRPLPPTQTQAGGEQEGVAAGA
jgi:Protein of unknown function (DUF2637)